MNSIPAQPTTPARIEYLKVQNFRSLRSVEFRNLTPLTVLLGPNGSGKSTVFDVFAFLAECFELGLRRAWDKRGRSKELVSREAERAGSNRDQVPRAAGTATHHLSSGCCRTQRCAHCSRRVVEVEATVTDIRFDFSYKEGQGQAISGALPDKQDQRIEIPLNAPDLLAVNALGQFADHPRVAALRQFITGWHVSYLSADSARGQPEAGLRSS